MSKEQLNKFIADTERFLETGGGNADKPGLQKWVNARIGDPAMVSAARHRLVEYGLTESRLATFPAEQVICLDEKRELEVRVDDDMKTMCFPFWQVEMLDAPNKSKKPPALFADLLVPITVNVRRAQGRLDQRIGLLRHIEALRLHAQSHNGTLPAELSEVGVQLPVDPFTGKPFRYELIGSAAHLRGNPPPGQEKVPQYNIHYELTIQK